MWLRKAMCCGLSAEGNHSLQAARYLEGILLCTWALGWVCL